VQSIIDLCTVEDQYSILSCMFPFLFELTFVFVLWFQSSIERLKVSRHLAEEAMNYFEECVSISTMDSTDFSSPDDPQPNSIVSPPAKNNSRFSHKGRSNFRESHTTDQYGLLEVSELISFVLGALLFHCSHLLCF
jgi:hypothetical protein